MKKQATQVDYSYMQGILAQIDPLFTATGAKGITLAREVTEAFITSPEPDLHVFARQWAAERRKATG